jgi:UDP-GlcNAc:undecaprenyl-phosphate GlcNAc-1-phosphate transferase
MVAALILTPLARRLALRLGVVDSPDGRRKLQKVPMPLLGGVAVFGALTLGLLAASACAPTFGPALRELSTALIAASGFVCILGAIDDRWDLKPRIKLLLQVCSVLPVVLSGYYVDRVVAFGIPIELGWFGVPLTVLWLVGCINALNLLDGMDGLAGIVGLSTAVMMAVLAANTGHPHVALVAMVLAGALAGFLVYNLPPASIYLGDCGSMIIGLVTGILSIQAALKTSATLSITAPAVALAVPMLDTSLAIVRRRLRGVPFDDADRGHIHHRLLDRGLTPWQALCIIGALCLTTGAAATAATILSLDAIGWVIMLAIVVVLVRMRAFGHHELALVKMALAAMLSRLGHQLVDSAMHRPRHLHRVDFESAWSVLWQEVSPWKVQRLEFVVRSRGGQESRVRENPQLPNEIGSPWALEMQFTGELGTCELRISGLDHSEAEPLHLTRVARLLKSFGQHWAGHLDQVPPVSSDIPASIRLPNSNSAPHTRAA